MSTFPAICNLRHAKWKKVHQTLPRSELDAGPMAETLPVHMQALLQEQAELLDEPNARIGDMDRGAAVRQWR